MKVDGGEGEGSEGEDWLYGGHRVERIDPFSDQEHLPNLLIYWAKNELVKC